VLKMLIVRSYRYTDKREGILREIDRLWAALPIPDGVRVKTVHFPLSVVAYPHSHAVIPYLYRWVVAWKEWLAAPAEWVVVFDGDVFPYQKDALFYLKDCVMALPEDVVCISSTNTAFANARTFWSEFGLSCYGLSGGFGDGIKGLRAQYLPQYCNIYLHHSFALREHIIHPELAESYNLHAPKVRILPLSVCTPVLADYAVCVRDVNSLFVHPLNDVSALQHLILRATQNIIG